jgi:hypothetical protein
MTDELVEKVARELDPETYDLVLGEGFPALRAAQRNRRVASARKKARAFLASLKASGWTLARVEPTEKMEVRFFEARAEYDAIKKDCIFPRPTLPAHLWPAMLAAQEGSDE